MKRFACLLLSGLLLLALSACGGREEQPVQTSLFAMDTYMTLTAYGSAASDALAAASQEINRLERELSRTVEQSDISRLNQDGRAQVSEETAALVSGALAWSEKTGGLFDITIAPLVDLWGITGDSPRVPEQSEIDALLPLVGGSHVHTDGTNLTLDDGCRIDLGGIAKGYASDRVAEILSEQGVTSAAVSLGGNVYVRGSKPDGLGWSVAIQDPQSDGYALTLSLKETFAVTSGGYQRYFTAEDGTVYQHILDPRTGAPADSDLLSVTIIASNGTMADAYSTALYVMGEQDAVSFWRSQQDFDMVLITRDGRIVCTPGLKNLISNTEESYVCQILTA